MTELSSVQVLESKCRELFASEVIIELGQDELTLKNGSNSFYLSYDEEELELEFSEILETGLFYTISEGKLSFILKDNDLRFPYSDEEHILATLSESIDARIKKDKRAFGLLINNLEYVVDTTKLVPGEVHTIDEIINDKIIICEVNFGDSTILRTDEVDYYIESIRAHLSYTNNLLLENPKEDRTKLVINNDVKTDEIRVNLLKDKEPLAYFLFAESVEHLHLKYLEYYHVLEYYFLHKRIKDVEKVIKNLLAIEMTKRNDGMKKEYYKDLINLFDSYFKKEDKNTAEIEQLEYVINSDLGYNLLRHALVPLNLNFLKENACEIKGTKLILDRDIFRGNNLLEVEDEEVMNRFCKQLSKRIYQVRNFIVHSKKFERERVFTPTTENLLELKKEVELIRILAYTMLNKA